MPTPDCDLENPSTVTPVENTARMTTATGRDEQHITKLMRVADNNV